MWDLKTQEVAQAYNISASAVTSVTFSGYKDEHVVAGSERYSTLTPPSSGSNVRYLNNGLLNCSGAISVCDVRTSDTAGFLTVDPKYGVRGLVVNA